MCLSDHVAVANGGRLPTWARPLPPTAGAHAAKQKLQLEALQRATPTGTPTKPAPEQAVAVAVAVESSGEEVQVVAQDPADSKLPGGALPLFASP